MADEKNFNFNVSNEAGEPVKIELVQRTGTAAKIYEKKRFTLKVLILALWEWVSKRNFPTPVQENPGVIIFSKDLDNPFIKFVENPNDELSTELEAELQINEDLTSFGINTGLRFSQREMENLVRQKAHCFPDLTTAKEIIEKMRNFDVRYEQQVQRTDDRRGNTEDAVKSAIKFAKGELPPSLTIVLPLYYGTSAETVTMEIEVDKGRNNLPEFSFYSLDLELKKKSVVESAIDGEVAKFKDQFPVLEV